MSNKVKSNKRVTPDRQSAKYESAGCVGRLSIVVERMFCTSDDLCRSIYLQLLIHTMGTCGIIAPVPLQVACQSTI